MDDNFDFSDRNDLGDDMTQALIDLTAQLADNPILQIAVSTCWPTPQSFVN